MDGSYDTWHRPKLDSSWWDRRITVKQSLIVFFVIVVLTLAAIVGLDAVGVRWPVQSLASTSLSAGQG